MQRIALILLFSIASLTLFAQSSIDLSFLLEDIESDEEREIIVEQLQQLLQNPLDINQATEEELLQIPYFDSFFVRNLLLYRSRNSYIKSIYDLKSVQGAPLSKLPLLEPFIFTSEKPIREISKKQEIYVGSEILIPQHPSYHRGIGVGIKYEGAKGNLQRWGILLGRDRDEKWLPLREGIADHCTFSYIFNSPKGFQITFGDYKVSTGLGLLMGQDRSYFSRAEISPTGLRINPKVIRPHLSFREYDYLRGVAIGTQINQLHFQAFYGIEHIDARVYKNRISTIYKGGMHRTKEELALRNQALLQNLGANLYFQNNHLLLGITGISQNYSNSSYQQLIPPQNTPRFQSSLYFQWSNNHFRFFGESLLTNKEKIASTAGISYYHELLGTISMIGRYLGTKHYSIYSYPDAHYSTGRNEKGIKVVWNGELGYHWSGSLYTDIFRKIIPEHGISTNPGVIVSAKAFYGNNDHSFQGRVRWIKLPDKEPRSTIRFTYNKPINHHSIIRLGSNLNLQKGKKLDWALFTRFIWSNSTNFKAELSAQYFHLSHSIIRADQPYMPHRYYAPMLRGSGWRTIAALQYSMNKHLKLNARASMTFYREQPNTPIPSLLDISARYSW